MNNQGKKRAFLVLLSLIIQVLITAAISSYLSNYSLKIEIFLRVLSVLLVLIFLRDSRKISNNIFWILLFAIFPILGTILFVFLSNNLFSSKLVRNINKNSNLAKKYLIQDDKVLDELEKEDKSIYTQMKYISNDAGYPVYNNSIVKYLPTGEDAYRSILNDIKKAKKYIFLEFFILKKGTMLTSILEALKDKVNEGVEVKLIYDDVGSLQYVPDTFDEELEKIGIQCVCFNELNPVLNLFYNNRDHRKIVVIDGFVSYTGGINIGDEYINLQERFGYWKDNAVRIEGEATWSFTVAFLKMWNNCRSLSKSINSYKPKYNMKNKNNYIAPYCSNPLKKESVGENVYLNMINQATKYIYITTPYLIVDNDMIKAFVMAKKRGVDIKIITPGIPDKPIVYNVTRSYYKTFLKNGIEIYEYTPGFIHSKIFVIDDKVATIGTINLDYRSLDMHFECSLYINDKKVVKNIKDDVDSVIEVSKKVTINNTKNGIFKTIYLSILRLFAPLM